MPLLLEAPQIATIPAEEAEISPPPTARVQVQWRKMAAVLRVAIVSLVAFLVVGNLLILGVSAVVKSAASGQELELAGVPNLHRVDDTVWRGAAPSPEGYESLADAGMRTVVDLRAEEDLDVDLDVLADLGIEWVHIPIRDGQAPSQDEVDEFLTAVDGANGPVYVHCGAGVGRTGTMAAAYLTATGQASGLSALRRNLSVGPPSLEQIAFAAGLEGARIERPNAAVVAFSRVLDAPRRLWSRYGL